MEMTIKKQIGKQVYDFTVEGKNLHEVVMEAEKLAFPDVHKCGLCGSDNLFLTAYVAQGKFKYTKISCGACKGSLTFGQRQDNADVVYLRRRENSKDYDWQKFTPKSTPAK